MKRRILIWFLVLVLIYLQYRLWFSEHGFLYLWTLEEDVIKQTLANDKSIKCNQILKDEIIYFKESKEAPEERARYEMDMIKKDEVYVDVDNNYNSKLETSECDILE